MGRKLVEGFIKREELCKILGLDPKKAIQSKDVLVLDAFEKGLIDTENVEASLSRRTSTLPCYLHTHIEDEEMRKDIEEYVKSYSLLYTRGSWLANLSCMLWVSKQDYKLPEHFPTDETLTKVPSFLKDENLVKHCFLPERWLLKSLPIDSGIQEAYTAYKDLLASLLPDYKKVMADTGWDNALNHMGTSYLGNVKVQICTHLCRRLKTYVIELRTPIDAGTSSRSVWQVLTAPISPNNQVSQKDYEWAMNVRNALGVKTLESWLNAPEDLTDYVWTTHLWLLEKLENSNKASSMLPVSTLSRKYAYIDEKVGKSLFSTKAKQRMQKKTENDSGSNLQKMLGLTKRLFNKRRSALRKKFVAKYKGQNKKLHDKWKKLGHGCLPPRAVVKMIKTDGVGLRICLEFPTTLQEVKNSLVPQKEDDEMFQNALHSGSDTGRVRICTSAREDGKVFIITRKGYYRAQRDHIAKKFEQERMTNTPWGEALAAQSVAGGYKNKELPKWQLTLEAFSQHKDAIIQEQVVDKSRSLMAMRRFRWKKGYLDHHMKELLKPVIKKKKPMILGIGDGDFHYTGRGEMAVPTVKLRIALKRVLRVHKIEKRVKVKLVDERNTTKCCHRCHRPMKTLTTPFGFQCLRYRVCTKCTGTIDKRRNRDVNAAKNILHLTILQTLGLPRPEAFCKNWTSTSN